MFFQVAKKMGEIEKLGAVIKESKLQDKTEALYKTNLYWELWKADGKCFIIAREDN